jgi:hypothetical protein
MVEQFSASNKDGNSPLNSLDDNGYPQANNEESLHATSSQSLSDKRAAMIAHRSKKYQDRLNPANQFIHSAGGYHNSGAPIIRAPVPNTQEEVKIEKGFDANQIDGPGDYGNIPGLKPTTITMEVHSFNNLGYFCNRHSKGEAKIERRRGEKSGK